MKTWKISIRHSNKPCMNTAVLLYMVGRCAWWVGAWVAGVLYVPLLYCCGTAVRSGCGWVVGAFDFKPPLVLQRTKSKTHCCVSTCFILSFPRGYVLGAVSSVSVATRIAYHITYVSRSRHPALRVMGLGIWNMTYNRIASQSIVKYVWARHPPLRRWGLRQAERLRDSYRYSFLLSCVTSVGTRSCC